MMIMIGGIDIPEPFELKAYKMMNECVIIIIESQFHTIGELKEKKLFLFFSTFSLDKNRMQESACYPPPKE